ncbi:hypothetical protein [Ralstonia sp. UBA689]|uniref:hypothetical protein n=1 Tax=Ralstonia sp. UBA689 TaxID=1947373 RepID=UPI0025DFF272|nr:hypothetical protein [Ralstonia sp. UBA689]
MLHDLRRSYWGVRGIFSRYWNAYGGKKAVLTSPYLHASIVLAALLCHLWRSSAWWVDPIAALPTMIGFAIGAYAIVLGFGDERFRAVIMLRKNGDTSPYVKISASLAHFIVVQLTALLAALIAKGLDFGLSKSRGLGVLIFRATGNIDFLHDWVAPIGNFVGFALFMYAILTALATAMAIFRLTTLVERNEPHNNDGEGNQN